MEETAVEKKGVYMFGLIIAFLVGGPFVTGWLASENLKEFGELKKAKIIKILGIVLGLLLLLGPMLVYLIFGKSTGSTGALGGSISILLVLSQGKKIKEYKANGGKERSKWPLLCIIFVMINLILFALSFL